MASPDPVEGLIGWERYDRRTGAGQQDEEGNLVGLPGLAYKGRHALFISIDGEETAPEVVERAFGKSEEVFQADLVRAGERLRRLRVFALYGYRGLPL